MEKEINIWNSTQPSGIIKCKVRILTVNCFNTEKKFFKGGAHKIKLIIQRRKKISIHKKKWETKGRKKTGDFQTDVRTNDKGYVFEII